MEDKDEENEKKSETQSLLQSQPQSQPRSRSKLQSEVDVSKEAEENVEAPPTEPSVKYSRNSNNVATVPSVVKTKSASEKSKSNILSPGKVSIKTTGENEPVTESVSQSLPKESSVPSSQVTVVHSQPSGGGVNSIGSKGAVVASNGGGGGGGVNSIGSKGAVVASNGGGGGGGVNSIGSKGAVVANNGGGGGGVGSVFHGDNFLGVGSIPCAAGLLQKRSPFIHDPPYPEERRERVQPPRSPIDYIINLREDLADFQESHGLPRTRDYSFVSLGLALAQETGRAIFSVFQMFTELFPILAIISLILRFALDKLIEILETTDSVAKIKKSIVFALEMLAIMIPLWILFGTIIIPLITLILSLFKRVLRIKGGKKKPVRAKPKVVKTTSCCLR